MSLEREAATTDHTPRTLNWVYKVGRANEKPENDLCKTHIRNATCRVATVFNKLNRPIKTYLPTRRRKTPYKKLNTYGSFAEV